MSTAFLPASTASQFRHAHQWPDTVLDYKRLKADPLADQAIAEILACGQTAQLNAVFGTLVRNDSFQPSLFKDFPEPVFNAVSAFFEHSRSLPAWADRSLLAAGQEVFSLYGPEIAFLLNVKSLPMCYACWRGAHVLYRTGRLTERSGSLDPLARRLMETSQMVMNVLAPGGMQPGGKGIVTLQKVRLIHASIRYFLKHSGECWDLETYGEPINQEDLAGTLMSFSALVVDGLQELGIQLSATEREGYMHCWRVAGYLMGIDEDLLPTSYQEGWELGLTIMGRQAGESTDARELTDACVDFLQHIIPGNLFDSLPQYFIWYFTQDVSAQIGKDLSAILGVQEADGLKERLVLRLARMASRQIDLLDNHSTVIRKLSTFVNRELLRGFLRYYNQGKAIHFYIPPSLQRDWKL